MNHGNALAGLRKLIARTAMLPLCAAFGVLGTVAPASAGAVYKTFDPPGSANTQAWCMNDGGAIAGNYYDSKNVSHGFVRAADGTIKSFDPTGSIKTQVGFDQCINTKGWVTGSYLGANQRSHGYVRAPNGAITAFDPTGSTYTSAWGINSSRTIVGTYQDSTGQHGFLRTVDGTITSFDPPGSDWTVTSQINRNGDIAGAYYNADGTPYVFVRSTDGNYISSDLGDGSLSEIYATGINNDGYVAGRAFGTCGSAGYCTASFVWAPDGTYTFFYVRFRRRDHDPFTLTNCINGKGLIAGYYSANDTPPRGFTRSAAGTIRRFDPPGSTATYANGCNNNGNVTGYYLDSSGVSHGFLTSKGD